MSLAKQTIRMADGSTCPITEFDFTCEAKDAAGRHFKGYAELIYNTNGEDVHPEDRGYWMADGWFDGDWGLEASCSEPAVRVQKVTKMVEVTEWEPI